MELTDDIENGRRSLTLMAQVPPTPWLTVRVQPAGKFAEPGTTGIVPVQPQYRQAAGPLICGLQ
jgi:hypothetical protein